MGVKMGFVTLWLRGGPRGGTTVKYAQPLPKRIVFTEFSPAKAGFVYNDYERRVGTTEYDWVDQNERNR